MKKAVAEAIVTAGQQIGHEIKLYEGYNGRSMYGATTSGVVYDNEGDFLQSIAQAVLNIKEDQDYRENLPENPQAEEPLDTDTFIENLATIRKDNMGYSTVAY